MSQTDEGSERRMAAGLAVLFGGVLVLAVADLAGDLQEGGAVWHIVLEASVGVLAMFGATWMSLRSRGLAMRAVAAEGRAAALEAEAGELAANLAVSRAEAERWRTEARDLIEGLGAAIDRQLDRWGLSPAEREVALLLLKGLSHREVAEVRGVSETTVRQQARALYKKAGLTGRADLAAFFLEDLLAGQRS